MNHKRQSTDLLCIFSRYPQHGKCKTRLIPKLGAKGAADLQRRMTEYIVQQGLQVGCDVVLWLDGGTDCEISDWLGRELSVLPQPTGDLGERMESCFNWAFTQGYQRVVLVGADCPAIDASLLSAGFAGLDGHDLVLGPSFDGGYYLIGMKERLGAVFTDISWGSNKVFAETVAAVEGRAVARLPILRDVDHPEDLYHLPPFLRVEGF